MFLLLRREAVDLLSETNHVVKGKVAEVTEELAGPVAVFFTGRRIVPGIQDNSGHRHGKVTVTLDHNVFKTNKILDFKAIALTRVLKISDKILVREVVVAVFL